MKPRRERLDNCSVYFFMDNTTVKASLFNGTSKSKKLLVLVIKVKLLETRRGIRILVGHVSGNRMIAEGGDGVSRGSLNEGVMTGEISWILYRFIYQPLTDHRLF